MEEGVDLVVGKSTGAGIGGNQIDPALIGPVAFFLGLFDGDFVVDDVGWRGGQNAAGGIIPVGVIPLPIGLRGIGSGCHCAVGLDVEDGGWTPANDGGIDRFAGHGVDLRPVRATDEIAGAKEGIGIGDVTRAGAAIREGRQAGGAGSSVGRSGKPDIRSEGGGHDEVGETGRCALSPRDKSTVVVSVHNDGVADLPEVGEALRFFGRLARLVQGRKKDRDQEGDDADDNQ